MTISPEQALPIAIAHYNMGSEWAEAGRWNEAIEAYRRAIGLQPELVEAHNNLGIALRATGQTEEAISSYRRALELRPEFVEVHNNLGILLAQQARWEEAIVCYQHAVALRPDFALAHQDLGILLLRAGSFEQALVHFRRAVAADANLADAHLNIGLIQLLLGRYEEGWHAYEWRWKTADRTRRRFAEPPWDGAPVPGHTILVHTEQGFGDAIQFARYLPLVRERAEAARVIFECPPSLDRLFTQSGEWNAEMVSREAREADAALRFDRHVPLLSLPLALERFAPLPMEKPYLRADAKACEAWRARLDGGFRVGVAWAGSPAHEADQRRSIPFATLAPIFNVPGAHFYSLQIGAGENSDSLVDLTAQLSDFADTAALMMELDLVISVDTAVAHLAGALGRPVWTLLPFVPDWRWSVGGEETPWYPNMRLFRQPAVGDWDAVVRRVVGDLRVMTRR